MVGIPVGTTYTTDVRGRAAKEMTCERCGARFVYFVYRTGAGTGESVLWLDNAGAQARAARRASEDLQQNLAKAVDPVACVACGWYQADMVGVERRRRGRPLLVVGLVSLLLGAMVAVVVVGFVLAAGAGAWFDAVTEPIWSTAAFFLLVGAAAFTTRRVRCAKWSPNSDADWKRRNRPNEEGRAMLKEEFDRLQPDSAATSLRNSSSDSSGPSTV